jgi:hypothetical protein
MTKKYYNPDLSNITNEFTKKAVRRGVGSLFCANIPEQIPVFDKAPCEKVISGEHNSFIVLGRDRNESWASGAGGAGLTECGMIDLVVGRGQLIIEQNKKNNGELLEGAKLMGPAFHSDAARLYITQKSENIDEYFGLKESNGPDSSYKSAAALKADHIRFIGREKVRIYCGRGNFEGFDSSVGETNCLGDNLENQVIELQVGNQELHPMVLGNKLIKYLKRLNNVNKDFHKAIFNINANLMALNAAVAVLTAGAPPFSTSIKDNIEGISDSITQTLNSYISELNSLDNDLIPGEDNILSNSVYTT